MHSSRMRTVRCSGRLFCHACPLPCTPPVMHTPPPCTSLPHIPPQPHTPPAMHAPLQCPSLPHTPPAIHAPTMYTPLWTEFLTHACENITFPQLLLWTVITLKLMSILYQLPIHLYTQLGVLSTSNMLIIECK